MPPLSVVRPDGPAIRRIRIRSGYTASALARKIGRNPHTILNLELDGRNASEVLIAQIANALGIEPGEITLPDEETALPDEEDEDSQAA